MGKKRSLISVMVSLSLFVSLIAPGTLSYAAGKWGHDSNGWYYQNGGSYYAGQWAEISGNWYYFTSSGYMDYSEYRDGCWLGSDGVWNTAYSNGHWCANSTGWWFDDNGWYANDQWLWINGNCYHFDETGYMEHDCYRDGYWLGSDGAWDSSYYGGAWKGNDSGWWFEDASGWFPVNMGLWINGEYYWFGADGYWDPAASAAKKASGEAGRSSSSANSGSATGNGSGTGENGNGENGNGDESQQVTYGDYSYKITPMLPPFNEYFYIQTDNPDPDSFSFIDSSTKYSENGGSISVTYTIFSDVQYEDVATRRVKGGYIAYGSNTDGGELTLRARTVTSTSTGYNISTGETYESKNYEDVETDVKITIADLVDDTDYLIQTYGGDATDYFGKMSAIQSGFYSICLYTGASIRGNLVKSTTYPYYGLSNSPHVDQNFYIQSPYSRKDGKKLLVSYLYPYRYDSIGFPSKMRAVSERIQPDATYEWSKTNHSVILFTYNGETKGYGGQGHGGGQQILQDMVNYWYKFDGSEGDAYTTASLDSISTQLKYYGSLSVPDDVPTEDKLTWKQVKADVGTGKYVKLIAIYNIYGSSDEGYTYLYDNGSTSEGSNGFVSIGYFSNAWFEGRYYNRHEIIEQDLKFGDEAADGTDSGKASIVIKDFTAKLPDDGNTYKYNYSTLTDDKYNASTGLWKGYTTFRYDETSGNWIADVYTNTTYYEKGVGYKPCEDADFVDACTLTPDEVTALKVDKNTSTTPDSYLIYDKLTAPGTPFTTTN
ncbi:Putative cell wall binding repeat-containing protein [Lachnospiraceae bacterium NE2001]|nr:Putative cell wall binding repeat-containing protein [Lachnospiraceae bacterium NE2001]